jgi:hypothetical protein
MTRTNLEFKLMLYWPEVEGRIRKLLHRSGRPPCLPVKAASSRLETGVSTESAGLEATAWAAWKAAATTNRPIRF